MFAIALDVGGTKISGSIVDESGKIKNSTLVPTQAEKGSKHVIRNILGVIKTLRYGFRKKLEGIGICLPGIVNRKGEVVFGGGSLSCLVGCNLKKEVERVERLPVFIANDADCFALGEAVYGAGKGHDIVVGIIWGTGIGGGIIINKKIVSGSAGKSGEIGHVVVEHEMSEGKRCACGHYGCLEMLASGKNIVRRYKEKKGRIADPNPASIYKSKEAAAKEVIDDSIRYMGLGLSYIVNIIGPDIIVLGGGVSNLPDKVLRRIEKEIRKNALPAMSKKMKLVKSKISDEPAILGAANLVFGDF